jgi:hypothetical protein
MKFRQRRFLTAGVSLLVLLWAQAPVSAQTADAKRPATQTSPPWAAKAKKPTPTIAAAPPADAADDALPALVAAPIDVRTRISIPAQEEAALPGAPRSSFDYERPPGVASAAAAAPNLSPPPPWAAPPFAGPKPGDTITIAQTTATTDATGAPVTPPPPQPTGIPSWTTQAFIGAVAPMACHATRYQVFIDDRAGVVFPRLCEQPDGSFRFAP